MKYAKKRGIPLDTPWRDLDDAQRHWVLDGEPEWVSWRKSWPGTWYGVKRFFKWLETKAYKMHVRVLLSRYRAYTPCATCGGARLKPDALLWRLGTRETRRVLRRHAFLPHGATFDATCSRAARPRVHDLMLLPIERRARSSRRSSCPRRSTRRPICCSARSARASRYLCEVGLGYLTLDRQSRTLSGGEVQRINLTTALGTSLVNTLFVLDEPSIGLHPRDMGRVIDVMQQAARRRQLAGRGRARSADHARRRPHPRHGTGPGRARRRDRVLRARRDALRSAPARSPRDYLAGRKRVDATHRLHVSAPRTTARRDRDPRRRRAQPEGRSTSRFRCNRLVCVTGVSGSGKSTLVQDVLYAALLQGARASRPRRPGAHRALRGARARSTTSCWSTSRRSAARRARTRRATSAPSTRSASSSRDAPLAKERGYTPGTFSFNSGNGRCPTCGGNGFEHVEMQFLSDVYLRCPDCDGRRYRAEVLEVKLDGRIDRRRARHDRRRSARVLRRRARGRARRSQPLADVGLDYLRLGQPVPTLSGGEAQRLKLAGHLARSRSPRPGDAGIQAPTPTPQRRQRSSSSTSRRPACTSTTSRSCCGAFRKLIAAGHSLVVIEHNLDVIRAADWIIDLGPEGGDAGGEIVVRRHAATTVMACDALAHRARALEARTSSPCQRRAERRDAELRRSDRRLAEPLAARQATRATRSASTTRASTT